MSDPAFRTEGIVDSKGHIEAIGLPFAAGQKVQLVIWAAEESPTEASSDRLSPDEIKRRLQAFDELLEWNRANLKDLPILSDEAMSRESIYQDRGL